MTVTIALAHTVGAKKRDPDGDVVAAEGERHRKCRDAAAFVLLSRLLAVTPGVDGKAEGRDAQQPHPAKGDRSEQRADAARERHEHGDPIGLSPRDTSVFLVIGDDELCSEREEVVEHRADKRER